PAGLAGDRRAKPADARRAIKGPALPHDAQAVEARIVANTMLAVLEGPRGAAFAEVMSAKPTLGGDAVTVLAHLEGPELASAYGTGLGPRGTGEGGGGTGEAMLR